MIKLLKKYPYTTLFVLILLVSFIAIFVSERIGIPEDKLEQDVGKSAKIPDDWNLAKAVSDDAAVLLYYNDAREMCKIFVYTKHKNAFGYFFAQSESFDYTLPSFADGVQRADIGENSIAFVSMNGAEYTSIVTDNGVIRTTYEVNPDEPFVVIVPKNSGEIKFYKDETAFELM